MLFSSLTFLYLFLPAVLLAYAVFPARLRNGALLAASLLFYFCGEPEYTLLILGETLVSYLIARWMAGAASPRLRRALLAAELLAALGALGLFKYADFAIGTVNALFGGALPLLHLALPIGISFYTFQTLSYVIDVYWGRLAAERNFVRYAAYVTLFPQLIAGPIVRYQDVAEEVIRMYGYDHVVPAFMPSAQVTLGGLSLAQKCELKLKNALCSVGAYEGVHYSFFSPTDLDLLRFPEDAVERRAIRIMNPISEELSLMRTTLAASMVNAIVRNQKKGNLEGRIFEIGNVFIPYELPLTRYPDEKARLCVGIFGEKESFYTMKGIAETIADTLHVSFTYEAMKNTFLHPYQTARVLCEGVEVGYFGKLAYDIAQECDLRTPVYLLEMDLKVLSRWYGKKPVFTPLPKFPEEQRDLALVVPREVTCGEIETVMKDACKYISSISLFDIYEGEQVAADKKSMAFTVVFTPKEEAFGAESVDAFVKKILKQLNKNYGVELRS